MLVLSLLLITITITSYFILQFYFGTRIYFSESFFLTIREVMLPLLFVSYEIFSQFILGISLMPWVIVFSSIAGMLLLLVKNGVISKAIGLQQLNISEELFESYL